MIAIVRDNNDDSRNEANDDNATMVGARVRTSARARVRERVSAYVCEHAARKRACECARAWTMEESRTDQDGRTILIGPLDT